MMMKKIVTAVVLVMIVASNIATATAADKCDLPVSITKDTYVAVDHDSLSSLQQCGKDAACVAGLTKTGRISKVSAGTKACAIPPLNRYSYELEVRLPGGDVGVIDEHLAYKIGWGGN